MPKPVKVVPIIIEKRVSEREARVFGVDLESHRVIFGITERRFALDILVSVATRDYEEASSGLASPD
jgi:hypothetical protein